MALLFTIEQTCFIHNFYNEVINESHKSIFLYYLLSINTILHKKLKSLTDCCSNTKISESNSEPSELSQLSQEHMTSTGSKKSDETKVSEKLTLKQMLLPMDKFCQVEELIRERETMSQGNLIETDYILPIISLGATSKFFNLLHQGLFMRRKDHLVEKIYVSFVRDGGEKYGKLSGSLGAASQFFVAHPDEIMYVNVDCGSRATKMQLFLRNGKTIHSTPEYVLPETMTPSALKIGGYIPKKEIEFNDLKESLKDAFSEMLSVLKGIPLGDPLPDKIKTGVFCTGPIRDYWKTSPDKQILESKMAELFANHDNFQVEEKRFFITQEEEGNYEIAGTKAMYQNLINDNVFEQQIEVVGVFSIGGSSTQWVMDYYDDSGDIQSKLFSCKCGMSDHYQLESWMRDLCDQFFRSDVFDKIITILEKTKNPTIVIKSGPAIGCNGTRVNTIYD